MGAQGVNSYAYVRNNPLGLIDPSGLDPTTADSPQEIYPDWSPTDLPAGAVVDLVGSTDLKYITVTLTVRGNGVTVTYTFGRISSFANGTPLFGVNLVAAPEGCDACRWAQVVRTDGGNWQKDGTDIGPLYPAVLSTPNLFWDYPMKGGGVARRFEAVTMLGVPDYQSEVFTVKGAITWGYSATPSGYVTPIRPAEASRAQIEAVIQVLQKSAGGWMIFF